MLKIDSMGAVLCLPCGLDSDGVLISLQDRQDLQGETCQECGKESA